MTNWLIFPLSVFFILGRLFSYLKSNVPLGYDSGLYLYLFKRYAEIPLFSFNLLPLWIREMYQPGIPLLGRILTVFFSPEKILVPLLIFFQMLLFYALYLLSKKVWDKKIAIWTVFIFVCSATQFRFYWYYYLKNVAAFSFLLFSFYFLISESYWAILFSVLVLYFHQQTAAFLVGVLLIMVIFKKKARRYFSQVLLATLFFGAFYYVPTFKQTLMPFFQPVVKSILPSAWGGTMGSPSGTFYNLKDAFLLSLPYSLFGLFGFWVLKKKKNELIITIPFLLLLPIVCFGFFMSRRFIPFLDLFLIFFAGYGATHFFKDKRVAKYVYIAAMVIFITFFIHKTGRPLIEKDELREIKMLSQTETNAYVLVTDNYYTPWVYGWSDRKPITPGLGEYDIYWTIPEWHQFWESDSREIEKNLLLKLPKPLYIYKGDMGSPIKADFSGDCFERINWRTYKFICY